MKPPPSPKIPPSIEDMNAMERKKYLFELTASRSD